jgi:hypothetical protein
MDIRTAGLSALTSPVPTASVDARVHEDAYYAVHTITWRQPAWLVRLAAIIRALHRRRADKPASILITQMA